MMRVYHLQGASHALSNIALKRLKIARFRDLNDPFELQASDLSDSRFRDAARGLKNEFHESRGILCFSRGWYNPVLWSHYADKHRGICLGFDILEKYGQPVRYSRSRLPVKLKMGSPNPTCAESR